MNNTKTIADDLINHAQTMFIRDGVLVPVAFTVDDTGHIKHKEMALKKESDRERIPEFLKELSLLAEAIIIIADSFLASSEIGDEETHAEALMCIIHTKDSSHVRYLLYKKNSDGMPIFFDQGWTDVGEGEWENIQMGNPFRD